MLIKLSSIILCIISVSISALFLKSEIQILINTILLTIIILLCALKEMDINLKKTFQILLSSTLLFFFVVILGAFVTTYHRLFCELILYGIYYFTLRKISKTWNYAFFSILISLFISVNLFFIICYKFGSYKFLPLSLAGTISFLIFCVLTIFKNVKIKIILYILIGVILSHLLYPQYIQYFSGNEKNKKLLNNIILVDQNNKRINIDSIHKKVIVLDYWHSRCGACFEGFPKYEELFSKYATNKDVLIGVVNVNFFTLDKENTAFELIKKYSFHKYKTGLSLEQIDSIGIKSYPNVMVFDSDKKLRYQGLIHYNIGINNINNIIEKILKEK
jgi:thiol-disulfide isomerase/thioredoxin